MRAKLVRLILLAVAAADGLPMPEDALISAVRIASRPADPTVGDVEDALRLADGMGFLSGVSDELTGRSWTLTDAGRHKVRGL